MPPQTLLISEITEKVFDGSFSKAYGDVHTTYVQTGHANDKKEIQNHISSMPKEIIYYCHKIFTLQDN